jgi:hypothetical protein
VFVRHGSGFFSGGGFAPISVQQLLNPVPGLGFDFPHLAAINHNIDVRAFIDPVTQLRLGLAVRLLQETPATSFAPFFSPSWPEVSGQQPVVIVLQQPPPATAPQPQQEAIAPPAPPTASPAVPDQPVPELGEFVLVRRDGSVILAFGFTQRDNRVVYVTQEGLRRSIPLADLDVDATQRMNENRGTEVRLHPS